ncbi:MAG: sialidase family protein [Acidimicrobiia bacterium]
MAVAVAGAACGDSGGDEAQGNEPTQTAEGQVAAPAELAGLQLGEPNVVVPAGVLNPTAAMDPRSGAVYLAWAREVPGPTPNEPVLQAVVARSTDEGKTFSEPVVVNTADERVDTSVVSPTHVAVGPEGNVYVLYQHNEDSEYDEYGLSYLRLVRSEDGGASFSAPVAIAGPDVEGVTTTMSMASLFVAPDGDLFISFIDDREELAAKIAGAAPEPSAHDSGGTPNPGDHDAVRPAVHLRMVRSGDDGRTWGASVLVAKPMCACCGTRMAQGEDGPLFATTRSAFLELKDSYDAVRDPILSVSTDDGSTWSAPSKIHDDKFKISACPDVTAGLMVDSTGRLHAAWYTGTESHPGVFYAVSDDDGKTFSKPATLLSGDWVPYGDVKMALDTDDHAWIAFEDRRTDEDQIRLVRMDPEGRASFSKTWAGTAPDITAGDGFAMVTWGTQGDHDAAGALGLLVARPGK